MQHEQRGKTISFAESFNLDCAAKQLGLLRKTNWIADQFKLNCRPEPFVWHRGSSCLAARTASSGMP
jgi:hypothetical protein